MHTTGGNTVHPVDQGLGSTIAGLYNQYVKTGDMTGTVANSFNSLAPFATNSGDYTALAALAKNDGSALAGPGSSDQVMCLSCHRAHASGFVEMLRFDQGYEFTTKGGQYVGSDNPEITGSRANVQRRGRTNAEWQRAYYERPARSLPPTFFAQVPRELIAGSAGIFLNPWRLKAKGPETSGPFHVLKSAGLMCMCRFALLRV
jgi:hypothetical protein